MNRFQIVSVRNDEQHEPLSISSGQHEPLWTYQLQTRRGGGNQQNHKIEIYRQKQCMNEEK